MSNIYKKLMEQLECLPTKDRTLCEKFAKSGKWEDVLEIAASCLYMKRQDELKPLSKRKWDDIDEAKLVVLVASLKNYTGISDDFLEDLEDDSGYSDDVYLMY